MRNTLGRQVGSRKLEFHQLNKAGTKFLVHQNNTTILLCYCWITMLLWYYRTIKLSRVYQAQLQEHLVSEVRPGSARQIVGGPSTELVHAESIQEGLRRAQDLPVQSIELQHLLAKSCCWRNHYPCKRPANIEIWGVLKVNNTGGSDVHHPKIFAQSEEVPFAHVGTQELDV